MTRSHISRLKASLSLLQASQESLRRRGRLLREARKVVACAR
jgi:hypothetical protein